MSKTLTRKAWNRAAADAARSLGIYGEVMAAWGTLDRALTPTEAVSRVLVALTPVAAPAAPVKAPVEVPAAKAYPLDGSPLRERIALHATHADEWARRMDADFGQGYVGLAKVTVYVDGRSAEAKALREVGFHRAGTGEYGLYIGAAMNLRANEIAADQLAFTLRRLIPGAAVYVSSHGN